MGALSWAVKSGHAGDIDEPGDDDLRATLVEILTGVRGGSPPEHFPWAWKESRFLGWRPVRIEIDHTPGRGWFRAGGAQRARGRPGAPATVAICLVALGSLIAAAPGDVPGLHEPGMAPGMSMECM